MNEVYMHPALPGPDLELTKILAVGFGSCNATRDGLTFYDEQNVRGEKYPTAQDVENAAMTDSDHDWRISFYAPMWEAVYQRQGTAKWALISKGKGFA